MVSKENKKSRKDKDKTPGERADKTQNSLQDNQEFNAIFSNTQSHEEVSEFDVFTGDEDFYKILSDSLEIPKSEKKLLYKKSRIRELGNIKFSWFQRILIVGIFTVVATMSFVIFKEKSGILKGPQISTAGQFEVSEPNIKSINPESYAKEEQKKNEVIISSTGQPASLDVAKTFYVQKNYQQAYFVYEKLYQDLPESEELLRDYLHLQMAVCAEENKEYEKASNLLTIISESRSPVIRIISNYRLCLIEIQRKRYLRARSRVYKALALLKAVDFELERMVSFERNCNYLVSKCLTYYIMSLSNASEGLPQEFWAESITYEDPFENMNETQLRDFLESGTEQLYKGLLAPKIKKLDEQTIFPRWSVTCFGAPLEEFLSKFATSSGLDIQWVFEVGSESGSQGYIIRQRPVSLHLPSATSEQIALIAAGCAELMAKKQDSPDDEKYLIYNPANYLSLNEHIKILSEQAISLWQKFMLTFHGDERLGDVHFAMGLLHTLTEQKNDAIAEYKLVANRFSQISLAPYALLKSSDLKTEIRDYQGAREDLKQLIEQYPDSEIYRDAYLRLADATKQAGFYADAAQLFCRVYNFELSEESKIESVFGAANCFYQAQAYEEAEIWFNRYINISGDKKNDELYSAHFLLGQTYLKLEKYEQACDSFHFAINEQTSREQYLDAVQALVQGYIEKGDFIKALDAFENTRSVALSQEQYVGMLIQKSEIYRKLGLFDAAIDLLKNRSDYVSENQLNAKISLELANCYIENDNLEMGRSCLSEVLRVSEPGDMSQNSSKQLAQVCLELGHSSQAISICLQLLDSDISENLRSEVQKILAESYNFEKQYEKAVLVLSGQY